jgi:hypothetical protein
MANTIITASFDREATLAEVRSKLGGLNLRHALSVVTKLASRYLWFPDSPELARYTNLLNLSILAKAVVLYASEDGRDLDLSNTNNNDILWLLKAVNSMQWFSRREVDANHCEALTSFLMRQGYARNFLGDHPVATVGRSFWMFYEHISLANDRKIDVNAAMRSVAGVSIHELWVLCAAIYAFYFMECSKDNGLWVFGADKFLDSPKAADVTALLTRAFRTIACTPDEVRQAYFTDAKYRHDGLPDEYWCSEFNILREFPIIALGNDQYCCPFPVFAWMRGTVGFYFDLVNHFGEIEKRKNKKNPNPLDNDMSRLLGDVFQEYVGEQLRSVASLAPHVKPEFTYKVGRQELRTPDWIIDRCPERPMFIECKARRPALQLQTRCTATDRENEVKSVIARAIKQCCVFIANLRGGHVPAIGTAAGRKYVYALVLYQSFPFHAFPKTRQTIDGLATALAPEWAKLRADVTFVPLSVQELEFALRVEKEKGVLIEDQLAAYSRYRESASFVVDEGGCPRFAMHFGDYVNQHWANGLGIGNEMLIRTWNRFSAFLFQELASESITDYHNRSRERWIKEVAYLRWINGGRQDGTHLSDWFASVQEYEELETALGMPPYRHTRMKQYNDIPGGFAGLGSVVAGR